MSKVRCFTAAIVAVVLSFTGSVFADTITEQAASLQPGEWLVCPMTGSPSDIVTDGTLVLTTSLRGDMLADSPYGITGDESVAGLSFHAFSDMFSNTTTQFKNGNFNGASKSYGNCGHTDDAYGRLLSEGWYGNTPGVAEFTYIGLQAGQTYLLQGFIHDGRDGTKGNKAKIGGVDLQYGDAEGGTWYYGGTFVHVFTPTGSTYKFSIDYSQGAVQMNAVQLRKVTRGADPFAGKTVRDRAAKLRPGEWLAMPMQGAATDIVTEGEINSYNYNMQTYEMAYAKGSYSGDDTVGNVKFRDAKDRLAINPSISKNADGLGNCGMTGDYATMLSKAWNADASDSGHDFTYSELEVGQTYLVQIVLHTGKTSTSWMWSDDYAMTAVITDGTGTAHLVECGAYNADDRWYYGGTFLHVFTATDTTYSFNVKFYKNDVETAGGLLNAIQLRKVERGPETIAEMAADLKPGEWLAAPLTGDAGDVLTLGEPITYTAFNETFTNAYAAGADTGILSLGGVDFVRGDSYKNVYGGGAVYGGHQQGNCGVAAPYGSLLDELYFKDATSIVLTVGPDNGYPALEPGEDYLVQIFIHSALWEDTATIADTDKTVRFCAQNAGDDWYYGGTFVHKFTATGKSYSFTINYSQSRAIYNAVQVRHLTGGSEPEEPDEPDEPVDPSIGSVSASVNGGSVTVTLADLELGTDAELAPATSYDVYAAEGEGELALVLSGQTASSVDVLLAEQSVGEHTYRFAIKTNQEKTSAEKSVTFTVSSSVPTCYFPCGNWVASPMSKDYTEIRTDGDVVYALASTAGNNGQAYEVNGVAFCDCDKSDRTKSYCLIEHLTTVPELNFQTDSFGSEEYAWNEMTVGTLLKRGWGCSDGNGIVKFALQNLTPGARYLVQLTAHNNGSGSWAHQDGTLTAPDGDATIQYGPKDGDTWKYGGTLVGTFIASNTVHAFTFTHTPASYFQFNTIQLRKLAAAPSVLPAYPTVGSTSVSVGRGSAKVTVTGIDAGVAEGACDVYYALAVDDGAFGAYVLAAENVTDGHCTFTISGTETGKSYRYKVYAANLATGLASEFVTGGFSIGENPGVPETMTVGPVIRPGLVQAKFGSGVLLTGNNQPSAFVSNLLTQTAYACEKDFAYGTFMANFSAAKSDGTDSYVNPFSGTSWAWDPTYTVFAYEGEIYLKEGEKLAMTGAFDDGSAAIVAGTVLFNAGSSSAWQGGPHGNSIKLFEAAASGWYPINAYVWDWSGDKKIASGWVSGLQYNLVGEKENTSDRTIWKPLEDTNGKGAFLRSLDSGTQLMTLGKPVANGVDVTIEAEFTALPYPAQFVAYVSTANDGGLDLTAWDGMIKIADIPAGDTAEMEYTVKGLAAYPFVRFAILSEGSISTAERCRNFLQMSCAVGFDSEGLAVLVSDPVFVSRRGSFDVVVASMGEVASLDLIVEVSADPLFGSTAFTKTIQDVTEEGAIPVEVSGLEPSTKYYIRVKPVADGVDQEWIDAAPAETTFEGRLRINEIMASNGKILTTKNGGEDLDWIEIFNGTDEEIDLAGWYLYDDPSKGKSKWKKIQGSAVIPVHGYKIIWCDKDYTDWSADEAWTEINLSSSGETVFLASPDGTVVDSVTFATQMKEVSYGVGKMPGTDEETMVFFSVPTPAAENDEFGAGPMTPTVAFSVPHGYKTEPIDVAITCAEDPDAEIYYTLDGTVPSKDNPAAVKYDAAHPIHIEKTTILRAGVPQVNSVLQIDSSATYIYLDEVLAQGRMGDGAISEAARKQTPSDKFPESGMLPTRQANKHAMRYGMIQSVVNGPDRDRILRGFTNTVATLSIVMDPELLFGDEDGIYVNSRFYQADGAAGERPMLLEQIDPVHGAVNEFSVPGGLRLRGAGSLAESNPKHSLRFFFRGKYGMSKLNFPLFGEEGVGEYSKVDLRCSQNWSWSMEDSECETFIHDVFSRDSQHAFGEYYTRSRYYNLFINGQYWGLYQTQERGDDDFAETYNGGKAEQYDCIKTSSTDAYHYSTGASSGTVAMWKALQGIAYNGFEGQYADNYYRMLGLNPDGSRNAEYPVLVNLESLLTYVTLSHYVCDGDGPTSCGSGGINNLYANRCQIDGASKKDGFWFLRHDAEYSLGVTNATEHNFSPHTQYWSDPTKLGTVATDLIDNQGHTVDGKRYRGEDPAERGEGRSYGDFGPYQLNWELGKHPVYKRALGDFFYKHYLKKGGEMTAPVARARFEARMAELDDVIVSEAARWSKFENNPKSYEAWRTACNRCLEFIDNRTPYMKAQYRSRGWYPSIDVPEVTVAADGESASLSSTDAGVTIYYTTDGSDPCLEGGDVSASAEVYADAIPVAKTGMRIKARARSASGEWSALQEEVLKASSDDGYTFYYTGDHEGNIVIDASVWPDVTNECTVIFDNANVNGKLVLANDIRVALVLSNDTVNTIKTIEGPGAHLRLAGADGELKLEGAGTLVSVSNLVVKSGTLSVKTTEIAAADEGNKTKVIEVLGHVKQTGGVIDVDIGLETTNQIYGIYLKNKDLKDKSGDNLGIIYAEFSGGEFKATVGGTKSAAIYVNKGSVDTKFEDDFSANVTLVGPEPRFVNSAGDIKFRNGSFAVTGTVDAVSARVFKTNKKISVTDGLFQIEVTGGGSEIFSTSIDPEDPKTSSVTFSGGTFELSADDDCVSADTLIQIDGGLFYAVSVENDVFDSNGNMTINGGTIMAYALADGHEAFDVDAEASGNHGTLTVNGGTIFATGGRDSAWPEKTVVKDGLNVFMVANADAATYSGKYLSLAGSGSITYTAKLPSMSGKCAVFATCPGFGGTPSLSDTKPASGDMKFHDLYIEEEEATNQQELRVYEIYGSTTGTGDEGEYIVLTNVSDKVVQLEGFRLTSAKDDGKSAPKVNLTLAAGTVPAHGCVRLTQADYTGMGWEKITNGKIVMQLTTSASEAVQTARADFGLFEDTDGKGASLIAKRFDPVMQNTTEYWRSSKEEPVPPPVADPDAPIIGGEEISDPIVVTSDKVTIKISNAGAGFTYGYKKSTTLEGLATAVPVWLAAPVDAPGILAIEIEKDPVEPTCFYQIMVK